MNKNKIKIICPIIGGRKPYLKTCIQVFLSHFWKRKFKENIVMMFASTHGIICCSSYNKIGDLNTI
jgi:hypothetical protein